MDSQKIAAQLKRKWENLDHDCVDLLNMQDAELHYYKNKLKHFSDEEADEVLECLGF